MNTAAVTSKKHTSTYKSHYQFRILSLLSVILLSVIFGYVTPETRGEGYQSAEVKSAQTSQRDTSVAYVDENITDVRSMPTSTPLPTQTPTPMPLPEKKYDKSRQIGEYTWTIDVPDEEKSGSAREVLEALNAYRQKHGRGALTLDGQLSGYAQSRADSFASNSKTDSHSGFLDYINNQDGFTKLGFMKLGENSSYGYKVSGTTLIESVYAGDSPHDTNQLSSDWTHVGVGVNGLATNLIFGGKKM